MIYAEVKNNGDILIYEGTVSDSAKHETIKFKFPDEWDGYQKTAVFCQEDAVISVTLNKENDMCLSDDECYIPFEVIRSPMFTVSVFGVQGNSRATAKRATVNVSESGYAKGDLPKEPTPTQYQQLVNLFEDTKAIAESVRTDADNGLFKGEKGEKGDTGELPTEYIHNYFASALKNTVSGQSVCISDASSIEHTLSIRLTSDEITDFSGIAVSRYGKNIFDFRVLAEDLEKNENQSIVKFDGVSCLKLVNLNKEYTVDIPQVAHGLSCRFYVDGDYNDSLIALNYTDGTTYYINASGTELTNTNGWYIANHYYTDKILKSLTFYTINSESSPIYVDLNSFMIEVSSEKTEYEECKQVYTVISPADGIIDGISSLSPNITLITNTEDVKINCTYNADVKMYIDNKIAELN